MPLKPKSNKCGSKQGSFDENFTGTEDDLAKIIIANAKYFTTERVASPEEAVSRIADMFQDCADTKSVPTVEKLALCLGMSRHEMRYAAEIEGSELARIIKKAKEIIASIDAEAVSQGKLNTVAYIFRAKNYYGLSDNVTVEHKSALPLGDSQDQSMLVGALLKQLQGQGQATIAPPSDYQAQPESATIANAANDFRQATMIDVTPSDYEAEPTPNAERLSSDYATENQATMPSDYETPSDYDPQSQATINPLTALGKALAEELANTGEAAVLDLPPDGFEPGGGFGNQQGKK